MKKFSKGFLLVLMVATIIFGTKVVVEMAMTNREAALDTNRTQLTKKNDLLIGYTDASDEEKLVASEYQLPVPLFNQLADPALEYGCEVTALSMLLAYYHFEYGKNELAKKITKEPYQDKGNLFGDPDIGFVGDMTGENPGTSVNVGPVYQLASELVEEPYEVVNSTGENLDSLLKVVEEGNPIWVIVTTDYEVPKEEDFLSWPTRNGEKKILPKHHAAVISGFDTDYVFLNDPYGKRQRVEKTKFNSLFEAMGLQSFYIK